MISKKTTIDSTTSGYKTLAHELVAIEEQNTGVFFAAFAIQYLLTKQSLRETEYDLNFLDYFGDVEIYASQRFFIKTIISNKKFDEISSFINSFVSLEKTEKSNLPHVLFFKRFNKSFLIRQIFKQTDQILPKYQFVDNFIDIDILNFDFDDLAFKIQYLTLDEKVLILVRIFNQLQDEFVDKRKQIKTSFVENIKRIIDDYKNKNRTESSDYKKLKNILMNTM